MVTQWPVTVVIINFRTTDLTRFAVTSLRTYYPDIPLLLIDNGSHDDSMQALQELQQLIPQHTDVLINATNIHHGPAMDLALRTVRTPYALFIDSDCKILKGDFVELMVSLGDQQPSHYAVGKRIYMNKRGFDVPEDTGIPYIRPICMLIRRELYLTLPEFKRHGAPCLENMAMAVRRGYTLVDFPVSEYVFHASRGTSNRHGYNLGARGKLNHFLNKLGL
jgi:glycosyltransferase involved in cell wall biosynthesis